MGLSYCVLLLLCHVFFLHRFQLPIANYSAIPSQGVNFILVTQGTKCLKLLLYILQGTFLFSTKALFFQFFSPPQSSKNSVFIIHYLQGCVPLEARNLFLSYCFATTIVIAVAATILLLVRYGQLIILFINHQPLSINY